LLRCPSGQWASRHFPAAARQRNRPVPPQHPCRTSVRPYQ
jgi:hypothetical protein